MDVNEYIKSGILEAYVLGGLSDKERQEVECMSSIYEEIGDELKKLQSGFEKVAQQNAVKPPDDLKASIMEAIDKIQQDRALEKYESKEAPIVSIHREKSRPTAWRAAAIIFVLVSAGLGLLYSTNRTELNKKSDEIASLVKTVSDKEAQVNSKDDILTEQKALNAFLSDQKTQKVLMTGSDIAPDASTRVYYNPSQDQIAFQVDFLPDTPSDKQYQLWAIVDGQPTDMGVLESDDLANLKMVDYAFGSPDAFAITLEKAGGSDQPDLSNIYVIGEV